MNPTDQRAYDRGSTIFSPDGRLYQVEYAREAVRRGSAAVGVRASDGAVLAALRPVRSELQVPESVEKLHRADDHLGVATAGHAADARRLVDVGRVAAQQERLRLGEPMGVEPFARAVADHVQESTQVGGSRPYGSALLVAGVDPDGPTPAEADTGPADRRSAARLFETDPSGTPTEWHATAIGDGDGDVRDHLAESYDDSLDLEAAVDLAVEALATAADDGLSPETLALGTVDVADATFRRHDADERRTRLADLGLLDRAS